MTANYPHAKRKSALRSKRSEQWLLIFFVLLLFGGLFVLLLGANMRRGLNHDEHQFVASAVLLARDAALPYADFAYFHVPLLSLVYAIIYQFEPELLLSARLLSVTFAWLMLGLIFLAAYRRRSASRLRLRLFFAALATGWMTALPLFIYTSGRAWNHDLPIFLLLLAFFIHSDALVERRAPVWLGASGLLLGLAAATRLSFVLMAVPFLLVLWLYPAYKGRDRWTGVSIFVAGGLIGAIPALVLFFNDPAAFVFGNFEYIRLNTEYYRLSGSGEAMTLFGKVEFLIRLLLDETGSLIAVLVAFFASWPLLGELRHRLPFIRPPRSAHAKEASLFRYAFSSLLLVFALMSAFAATPAQPQYFYILFPLLLLNIIFAVNAWPDHLQDRGVLLFSGAALATIMLSIPAYLPGLAIVFSPHEWYPAKVHARGQHVAQLVQQGMVLTLAPIHPLEGNAEIYPEFATGPFGWRVAPLVNEGDRRRYHLVAPEELDSFLADDPPRGILVALEEDDVPEELPFLAYANERGYVPIPLPDEGILWLSPIASWRDQIQLGGHTLPRQPVQAGDVVVLTLYLQNLQPIEENLSVLVRLVDAQGVELLRDEGWPLGSPTSSWQVDEVWADGHELNLPEMTTPGIYAVEVSFYDPAALDAAEPPVVIGHLAVGQALPAADSTPLARLGDSITLIGADLAKRASPGDAVAVSLTWRNDKALSADYTVFLHMLDESGSLVAQVDRPPLDGFYPTTSWMPGQPVHDQFVLPLPPDLSSGRYRLITGLYDPHSLQRLSVVAENGARADAVELGTILVE